MHFWMVQLLSHHLADRLLRWHTDMHTEQVDLLSLHDDVIKWKHFARYWLVVRGIHRSPVNSLHKGQRRGALMFSLICVWINSCVNNREAGDLRRYRAHYDVTMYLGLHERQAYFIITKYTKPQILCVSLCYQVLFEGCALYMFCKIYAEAYSLVILDGSYHQDICCLNI